MTSPTVLVVETHTATRDLYAQFLARHNLNVLAVASTDEALAHADRFDAVLTELAVKGTIHGLGLIRRIRAASRMPILVVSAHVHPHHRAAALAAGADAFFAKPCELTTIHAALQRMMRNHKLARAEHTPRARLQHAS